MFKVSYTIAVLIIFLGCSSENASSLVHQVKALDNPAKQRNFLKQIRELDQKVRNDESEIVRKFGHDSPEHKESWRIISETDAQNLDKIETYLSVHGHPTLKDHGTEVVNAPWLVIHHQPSDGARERNFKYLYKAYKQGDLSGGRFTFYLNRMYDFQFGERIKYNGAFTEEFEIDTLTRALELVDLMGEIDNEIKKGKDTLAAPKN